MALGSTVELVEMVSPKAFTPSREDPARLEARTVGRYDLLHALGLALHQAASTGNRPHTLLVGPRGSGKSHVLEVAINRAEHDETIASKVVFARLPEDAVGIATVSDVLFEVLLALDAPPGTIDIARVARKAADNSGLQRLIHGHIADRCLVLVIENLQLVMEHIGKAGQSDLRAWVESSGEVVVVASAPLLFHAVQSRTAPWFGSFAIEHLTSLSVDEGAALVDNIAQETGDVALAEFLKTADGQTRLEVVHHLAGGSPRIWTIFAACVSVALLDDLVPAVEELLEELVPYYQQRLWELPPTEQKLLDTLARNASSATVSGLSELSGVDSGTAATVLGRLAKSGWVTPRKISGLDQRETWYELREPLLRHHLQYRDNRGEELRLIVSILQAWFGHNERRQLLLKAPLGSTRAGYLAASIASEPGRRFDSSYAANSADELATTGRLWASGKTEDIGTREAGEILQLVVAVGGREVEPTLTHVSTVTESAVRAAAAAADDQSLDERISAGLDAAVASLSGHTAAVTELIATCWNGETNAPSATDRLTALVSAFTADIPRRLQLAIRHERAHSLGKAGRIENAITEYADVITDQTSTLSATHPDTLRSRHNHASLLGEAGRIDDAITELSDVITDCTHTLGLTHPDTLRSRHNHAHWLGQAGRIDDAITELSDVVTDSTTTLGATHPDTLRSRHNHASLLGEVGRIDDAITELSDVVTDSTTTLGATHPDTLRIRHNHAHWLGQAGRIDDAITELRAVVTDREIAEIDPTTALLELSRLQVTRGLSDSAAENDKVDIPTVLRRVALDADARAYAKLPSEIRRLIDAPRTASG
jgi:hypothetical protein